MIIGTMALISLFGLLFIAYRKIDNITQYNANKQPMVMVLIEFALCVIFLMFLLIAVHTTAIAAAQDDLLNKDAFEMSMYLFFGSFLLLSNFVLMVFEILVKFGHVKVARGRLKMPN